MAGKPRYFRVKIGKKGEIYTTKKIREIAGIQAPGELILIVREREIVIKKPVTLKELLSRKPVLKLSFEKAEKISETPKGAWAMKILLDTTFLMPFVSIDTDKFNKKDAEILLSLNAAYYSWYLRNLLPILRAED